MGASNSKPFGNDTALDWLVELERQDNFDKFIESTISKVVGKWDGDSGEAEEAIAAIAVVSAAAVDPVDSTHRDAKRLIELKGYAPTEKLLALSLDALCAIGDESELRDLWQESGGLKSWLKQTMKLSENLQQAQGRGLPSRTPKRQSVPRLLYKLIDCYRKEPSEKLRARIRDKVSTLDEVNKVSQETNYKTPLSLVAFNGLLEETQILLARGADPNSSSPNPFAAACVGGYVEVADLLRESGAEVFYVVEQRPTNALDEVVFRQMQVRGIEPKPVGYRYCLALFSVARSGQPEVAEYLIRLGADLHQTDLNDENLIHIASEVGNIRMLEFLAKSGLDLNRTKGTFGESPLHYAVRSGKADAVKFLLEHGANPNHIDKFEGSEHKWYETPLDICEDDAIRMLLKNHGGQAASVIMNAGADHEAAT